MPGCSLLPGDGLLPPSHGPSPFSRSEEHGMAGEEMEREQFGRAGGKTGKEITQRQQQQQQRQITAAPSPCPRGTVL